jgi:dihydrofolate synthase/folylpolyglutamate synthase
MTAYRDSVRFLYALGNESRTARLGLGRIQALLAELGHPEQRSGIIHVAGTNGKGSTCAMLESALRAAGWTTGLFTSPHLAEPAERIRIGGAPLAPGDFARIFDAVHAASEALLAREQIDAHPTYFECVTAMAFLAFREARVQWAVLEVGMGGRLDATNVVQPELCVITPVDLDHERYLGRGIESIAAEKAGIIKPGAPVVLGKQREEAERVLLEAASRAGVPVVRSAEWPVEDLAIHARGSVFSCRDYRITCGLPGRHQVDNALTALAALDRLGVPRGAIERGLAAAQWPGRLEYLDGAPQILLDGAHNPAGTRALAEYIEEFCTGRRITLIYGAMRDKAVEESAGILFPLCKEVILTAPRQARAVRPEALRDLAAHPRCRTAPGVAEALEMAAGADLVLVTGSLFLVGEARALLVQ